MELKLIHSGKFYKGVTKDRMGPHYPYKPYNVGTVHQAAVNTNLDESCAPGIHVCLTIAEALRWGPVVVEVGVPEDATIVVATKVRVGPSVKVLARDVQVGANLGGADLRGANLGDADLGGANLGGANLRGANLRDAYLRGAYLWGANLRGADLRDAYLRGAYLWGANLRGANLRDAYLWGANLRGANLRGADLRGADIWDADLWGANGNAATVLPVGYEVNPSGLIVRK
jgi:hypothetical protein